MSALPSSQEMEQRIVSACLQWPHWYGKTEALGITANHFHHPLERVLWKIGRKMARNGEPMDLASVTELFGRDPKAQRFLENGTPPRQQIMQIYTQMPSEIHEHLEHYCEVLRLKFAQRLTLLGAEKLAAAEMEPKESLSLLRKISLAVENAATIGTKYTPQREAVDTFVDNWMDKAEGDLSVRLPTGIKGLDDVTEGGLGRKWLTVIAGKTKGGKSMLATQIVLHMALCGMRGLIHSFEMTRDEVLERMVANYVQLPLGVIVNPKRNLSRDPDTRKSQIERMQRALAKFNELDFVWNDDNRSTLESVIERSRMEHEQKPLDFILIDYLQLMQSETNQRNREREVAMMSREAKNLSVDTNTCVIVLSQLNDQGRLRESRAIGQDANCVIDCDPDTGLVVTQRQGASDHEIEMRLNGKFARFEEPKSRI